MSAEDRCKRVGMLGSLRGRRSEEMTKSNNSSPGKSEVPFKAQRVDGS